MEVNVAVLLIVLLVIGVIAYLITQRIADPTVRVVSQLIVLLILALVALRRFGFL